MRPFHFIRPFILLRPVAVMGLAALAACGKTDGKSGGGGAESTKPRRQVVVLSPHGQEILDEFEKAFEKAHPDIDVVARFIPTGQILGQIRIDKTAPTVDVWWGGTSAFFGDAKRDGLLAPYRPTWADASRAEWHDPQDFWYAEFLQVPAIMFNSGVQKPEQMPKTFEGLLDPKWKGKIVIREPMNSGTMKTILAGMIWARGGEKLNPAPGYDFLKKLDAQTRSYLPDPQALYDRVAKSPEGYISLWNVTDVIFQAQANHYPFGFKIPEEPVPVSVDPIGIVAGAPHMEEAKLFYEFVTSKESCLRLAEAHYRILARTDIPKESLSPVMAAVQFEPMKFDPAEFDRRQAEWMEYWLKSIRDPGK